MYSHMKLTLSQEQLQELEQAEKRTKKKQIAERITMVKMKHEWLTCPQIWKYLWRSLNTVCKRINTYKEQWIEGIMVWNQKGRSSKLNKNQQKELREASKTENFDSRKKVQKYIRETFGIEYSENSLSYALKKRNVV